MKVHFAIGDWLVQPELNLLTKGDETIHLEPKVMQVLVQLALRPGQVLTKEELIESVWPGTFVSEQALTRCISILRRSFNDHSQTPQYIQTISKSGYRLVAHVHVSEEAPIHEPATQQEAVAAEEAVGNHAPAAPHSEKKTARANWLVRVAAVSILLVVVGISGLIWQLHRRTPPPSFLVIPFTSYAGQQDQAAFSPNGTSVAFVWENPENGSRNIYIKQVGNEATLRLTQAQEAEYAPAWSPDGTQIAYFASSGDEIGIYEISSLGGSSKKLYTPRGIVHWDQKGLSWSPDGKTLIFPDVAGAQNQSRIYAESLDTLQARPLTTPPAAWDGDLGPAFSPDGKKIAFIRASEYAVRDIYVMPAEGGEPRQITHDGRMVDSLAWSPDGLSILFSSDRGGEFSLWKVSARGGEPERLMVGAENAFQPAVNGATHRLLYTQSSATWSILGIPVKPGNAAQMRPIVSSVEQDSAPSFAPDGEHFAFQSWRSGTQELWIASRDGSNLRQLTNGGESLTGSPSFSPDNQVVAFDRSVESHSHVFVIPASGGAPRQLTSGDSNDILPRWSADGRFVYFASNRSGSWQSWKIAIAGGPPQQVTSNGGYVALESPDGHWIYYTKGDQSGLWRIPAAGGAETKVLGQPRGGFWGYWCMGRRGIYLLDTDPRKPRIAFFDFDTEKTSTVATLDHSPPPYSGLSVDRAENELLLTDERDAGSHITLVENFR